jgi:hypothetical protein
MEMGLPLRELISRSIFNKDNPMCDQYTTGLEGKQLDELERRIEKLIESGRRNEINSGARPVKLSPHERSRMVLVMLRHNLAEEITGVMFGLSQPRASVITSDREPILLKALSSTGISSNEAAHDRPIIIEGTYVTT